MRFTITLLTCALAALARAQNPFNIPDGGLSMSVGVPTTLSWVPTTAGTVSLLLRDGPDVNLNPGILLASTYIPFPSPLFSFSSFHPLSSSPIPSLDTTPVPRMLLIKSKRTAAMTNTGTFTFTPAAANSVANVAYTIEIVDDGNPNLFNFTPRFYINTGSVAPTSAPAAAPAPTAAAAENVSFPLPDCFGVR